MDKDNKKINASIMKCLDDSSTKYIRLAHCCDVMSRPVVQNDASSYTQLGLFNKGRGIFFKDERKSENMGDSNFFWVEKGDLILSGQFAWEGAVTMASDEETGCVISHRYPAIRGKSIATEYLCALLMTDFGDFLLNESSRGAAGRNRPLNIRLLLDEKIRLPSLEVQNEIRRLMYLRAQAEKKFKRNTELLNEYRQSLISNVVTGKVRVVEEVA